MRQNWKKNMTFGENVKTAAAGALKRRNGLLRDNLHNSPKRKALLREKLKHRGVRMWKITVGDPRQNHCTWKSLSTAAPEGISEILGTRDKTTTMGDTEHCGPIFKI